MKLFFNVSKCTENLDYEMFDYSCYPPPPFNKYLFRYYDKQLMVTQGVNSEAWDILSKIVPCYALHNDLNADLGKLISFLSLIFESWLCHFL